VNSKISFEVISTGSKGNAVVLENCVLIDCGVPYKAIRHVVGGLKLVLLTHIHSDHFAPTTVRRLAADRPSLRFGCGKWLASDLLKCGVTASNIDILSERISYGYGICNAIPFLLHHDVPNCGYKIHFPHGRVFCATDTNDLHGISAQNYDLYLVEANYTDEGIKKRIAAKEEAGEYAYERKVLQNHLSRAKCDDFIYRNIGRGGEYVYLHAHEEVSEDGDNA
jgi:phosphoribosyl 1,2-cyclic phosphodiesterase